MAMAASPSPAQLRSMAREERVSAAVRFLLNSAVARSPDVQKASFLLSKGLNKQEVAEAIARAKAVILQYYEPWRFHVREPLAPWWQRLFRAVSRLPAWKKWCTIVCGGLSCTSLLAWLWIFFWRRLRAKARSDDALLGNASKQLMPTPVSASLDAESLNELVEDARLQDRNAMQAAASLREQMERRRRALDRSVEDLRRAIEESDRGDRADTEATAPRDVELSSSSVRMLQDLVNPGLMANNANDTGAREIDRDESPDSSLLDFDSQAVQALKSLHTWASTALVARTALRTLAAILKNAIIEGTEMRREPRKVNTKSLRFIESFGSSGRDGGAWQLLELAGFERSARDEAVLALPVLKGVSDAERILRMLRQELKQCGRRWGLANGLVIAEPIVEESPFSKTNGGDLSPAQDFTDLRAQAAKWLEEDDSPSTVGTNASQSKSNGISVVDANSSPESSDRATPAIAKSPTKPPASMPWLSSVVEKQLKSAAIVSSTKSATDTCGEGASHVSKDQ